MSSARLNEQQLAAVEAAGEVFVSAGAGTGKTAGRWSTRPSVAAKSRLVTGSGEVTLIGPSSAASMSA